MRERGGILSYLTNMTLDELLQLLNFTTAREFIEEYDLTDDFEPIVKPLSTKTVITLVVCYSLIFVLALVGNALVVIVISRKRSMQTVINLFILSLAISDLLIVVFCIPFTLIDALTVDWVLGSFMCKALNYITMVAIVASVLTLTAIAFERHHAICYPLRSRMIQSPKRAALLLSILWGFSLILVSPLLIVLRVTEHDDVLALKKYKFCQEIWRNKQQKKRFTIFLVVFLYIIPLITMIILYIRVAHRLWIRKAIAPGDVPQNNASRACSLRYKKRATKMLVTVVVLFAICWLPYHIVSLARDFSYLEDISPNRLMLAVVQLIAFSNSFNNPVVYVFLNDNFKRNFIKTLSILRRRQRRRSRVKRSSTGLMPPYDVATTL
ncbi:QRFP-like peptide receptor isoform X3 [Amphiura filiformis]|uniref:QRFP-like peptide receptor isoform X3 n=1 Tax=Amphiura filiformis TaxID=82378 RepID=UPI003B21BE6A